MRDASNVPELQENQTIVFVYCVGNQSPAVDLFAAVNPRRPSIALALPGDLCGLTDDKCRGGSLRVVTGVERDGYVTGLARASGLTAP
jgi:hypothetical protein